MTDMHELRSLFKRYKQRSTENIFVTITDAARAMGMERHAMGRIIRKLPLACPLPVTRQYLETWIEEHKRKPRIWTKKRMLQVLEYRLIHHATDWHTSRRLNIKIRTVHDLWKAALKRYDELRVMSRYALPLRKEDAILIQATQRRRRIRSSLDNWWRKKGIRRRHATRKIDENRTDMDGETLVQTRA